MSIILAKRYTNPSADIITVLAGLDEVDTVFLDLANAIDRVVRNSESCKQRILAFHEIMLIPEVEARTKAVNIALSLTAGAYQTSLPIYFTHRDLFPALMKVGEPSYSTL